MKDYTSNSPVFSETIKLVETSDPGHADLINQAAMQLLQNTLVLKALSISLSAALENKLAENYQQATGYTDERIAALINGAPESLDTLKEVADAIAANKSVMDALDAAIGKKAGAAEFDSYKKTTDAVLGNTSLTGIGNGTVTGAISGLSTALGGFSIYPQKLTQAQYNALPAATKATQGMIFVIVKE